MGAERDHVAAQRRLVDELSARRDAAVRASEDAESVWLRACRNSIADREVAASRMEQAWAERKRAAAHLVRERARLLAAQAAGRR